MALTGDVLCVGLVVAFEEGGALRAFPPGTDSEMPEIAYTM